MSKFKAGDKVFWEFQGKKTHRVVSHQNGFMVWFTSGHWMHQDSVYFDEEDELPEVPEETRYECAIRAGVDYLIVDPVSNEETIRLVVNQYGRDAVMCLTPETALELSADLLRMALKMQRELNA